MTKKKGPRLRPAQPRRLASPLRTIVLVPADRKPFRVDFERGIIG